jgi:hypothetical protein
VAGPRDASVGGVGLASRGVETLDCDGTGERLGMLARLDVRLDQLTRGDLTLADRASESCCRTLGEWRVAQGSTVQEPRRPWRRALDLLELCRFDYAGPLLVSEVRLAPAKTARR